MKNKKALLFYIFRQSIIISKGECNMNKKICWIMGFVPFLVIFSLFEIKNIEFLGIKTLWHNLKFMSLAIYTLLPFFLIIIFICLLLTNKWAFRVEKLDIGGFSILFDNPNHLFKRRVRSFLDTKRSIFRIDINHDNFKEVLDSYYDVYIFFRSEINILGDVKKRKRQVAKETLELYEITNEIIKELNVFLTEHQSNYKRWYTYVEKNNESKFHLEPIGNLQKEYVDYNNLCKGFSAVNNYFISKVAPKFNLNIEKWGIEKGGADNA